MALISIVVIENIRRDFNESVAEHETVVILQTAPKLLLSCS